MHGSSVDDLVALGATVLDDQSFRWTVLADPEGGEFCLFLREQPPEQRLYEIGVDAADPATVATWWAETLGGRLVHEERGFSWVGDIPGAPFDSLDFAPVPEPKSVKNRIHLDLLTDDVDRLLASGATLLRPRDDEIQWSVLADPEGNEFCAFLR
ncbi:MAG: VOC family protein [Nocardioidaceae bacterium]